MHNLKHLRKKTNIMKPQPDGRWLKFTQTIVCNAIIVLCEEAQVWESEVICPK